jgi:hypothetical protein
MNYESIEQASDLEPHILNAFIVGFTLLVLILMWHIRFRLYKSVKSIKKELKTNPKNISPSLKYCLAVWIVISSIVFFYGGLYHSMYLNQEMTPTLINILLLLIGSIFVGFKFFFGALVVAFLIHRLT